MATNRSYGDNCGMAHALDIIGERWSLLIVRELLFGPKRFGDLKADLPGISSNVLERPARRAGASGVLDKRDAAAAGERQGLPADAVGQPSSSRSSK